MPPQHQHRAVSTPRGSNARRPAQCTETKHRSHHSRRSCFSPSSSIFQHPCRPPPPTCLRSRLIRSLALELPPLPPASVTFHLRCVPMALSAKKSEYARAIVHPKMWSSTRTGRLKASGTELRLVSQVPRV